MLVHIPDHFSSSFKFDISKTPAVKTDRASTLNVIMGWFFGSLLLGLGVFELFSFLTAEKEIVQSLLVVEIFSFLIIMISIGILVTSTLSFMRYKKIHFDGEKFTVSYCPSLGVRYTFTESVENYIGVRLRVLFIQNGLFNRSRYVIDLYHKDSNKIIPLYITMKNKNIRKIWEEYAKRFNLPALSIGDRGLIQRECADLDKSLKLLAKEDKLPYIASGKFPAPSSVDVIEKKRMTIVKPVRVYWDVFSILFFLIGVCAILLLTAGAVYLTIVGTSIPLKYWAVGAILLVGVIYFSLKLFKSYSLQIAEDNVTVVTSLFGSELSSVSLPNDKIENVELGYNPTIDRYNLAIISDEKILTFRSRMPVSDLIWVRDFLIRKLIGN